MWRGGRWSRGPFPGLSICVLQGTIEVGPTAIFLSKQLMCKELWLCVRLQDSKDPPTTWTVKYVCATPPPREEGPGLCLVAG